MPGPLANTRHEAFAQALAQGMTTAAAYAQAGYKPNRHNASRMSTNEHIKARVAKLQTQAARRTVDAISLSDQDFISRLIRDADHYGEGASHSARVQAIKLLGDQLGRLRQQIGRDPGDRPTEVLSRINRRGSAGFIATKRKGGRQSV